MASTARLLRKNPTEAERTLWRYLRLRQLHGHKFRRQQPLGPYVADFACLERRLIVEVDGAQHAEQAGRDAQRTAWLESQGFRVLRFWNNEVLRNHDGVIAAICAALSQAPPTSILPRKGGGRRTGGDDPFLLAEEACPEPSRKGQDGGKRG
ncbi:MAG: endonuclease domain-containing protein [Deltaproteobacteria bacterium]|nr:endonuclease domain-containing protein [Deltaproteobacteria bacterium]